MIGTGLGQFTITGHLGSGGMGDVYQATDSRLNREVAVKFLSEAFVHDASRLARFQREARALAALNHPNIATIHGFEEIGGRHFLVMELVRGTTLATKLAGGRLALDDTIRYGTQIADALAAAHARGIVHRDLKPGNIMVTKSGVKVLDFGLAKSADGDETLTRTEAIVGTPAYMAPEQREGGTCDARSDIYSFGLILLEMATGRRVVEGDALKTVPAQLARVIQGCLEREPEARWQSASDIKRALGWVAAPDDEKKRSSPRVATWTAVALVVGLAAGATSVWFFRAAPAKREDRVVRFEDALSGPAAYAIGFEGSNLALTPDGSRLVYVCNNGTQLCVRALDSLTSAPIASGTAMMQPFVSPNGQTVGYLDNAFTMKLVAITGGPSVTLTAAGRAGATWLDDDTIIAAGYRTLSRYRASRPTEAGETLITPDRAAGELYYVWPHALPDGHSILFTITATRGGLDKAQLAVFDMDTRKKKMILQGGSGARYVASPRAPDGASGYLVYVAQGSLRAIPFDLNQLATRGQAIPVPVSLVADTYGSGEFATGSGGMLAYVDAPGRASDAPQSVGWVDWSSGKFTAIEPPGPYTLASVSPDETKIALATWEGGERSIRILDVARQGTVGLRLDPVLFSGAVPVWLRDGKRIVFQGATEGPPGMWIMSADGTGAPERLIANANPQLATGIVSDGDLVFHEALSGTNLDILRLKLDGSGDVSPLLKTSAWEINGVVSPDRNLIAYECCKEELPEIWVSPYPKTDGGRQISSGGGRFASWSPGSDQLFFQAADGSVMRVKIEPGGGAAGSPTRVLGPGFSRNSLFGVSRDGRRLLTLRPADPAGLQPPRIRFVMDWVTELARASQ